MRVNPSHLAFVLLFAVACGSAAQSSDPPQDAPGASDSGRPPDTERDGGTADKPDGVAPVRSFGADTCGNGKDDDENGIVDDGCPKASCVLSFETKYTLPDEYLQDYRQIAFDHAARELVVGASNAIRKYREDDGSPVLTLPADVKVKRIFRVHGGYVAVRSEDPHKFYDVTLQSTTNLPNPTSFPFVDPGAWFASGGSLFALDVASDHVTARFGAFDSKMQPLGPLQPLTLKFPNYNRWVVDAGGLPLLIGSQHSWSQGTGDVSSFELINLGSSGLSWRSPAATDQWPGEVGLSLPWAAPRIDDRLLVCEGGPRFKQNSGDRATRHSYDCHIVNAKSGALLQDFELTYPITAGEWGRTDMLPTWAGDGWLLARVQSDTDGNRAAVVTFDRVSITGQVTKDVLTTIIDPGFPQRIETLGPDRIALVSSNGSNTRVALFGCK